MAIEYRSSSPVASGTTSLTFIRPTGVVENDIMIMAITVHDTGASPSVPTGWYHVDSLQGSYGWGYVYWKRATASEPTSYVVTGLADSSCGAISAYSGCVVGVQPVYTSQHRENSALGSGTAGITISADNRMVISVACIFDNLALSDWAAVNMGTLTERVDGRTTIGSDTSIGMADGILSAAGSTGETSYVISGSSYNNIGFTLALNPLESAQADANDSAHSVSSTEVGAMDQDSDLANLNSAASVSSTSPGLVEHKTLEVASSTHATESSTPTPVETVVVVLLTNLLTWIISSPAVGGVPGTKLANNYDVIEVSSYVTDGTSVTFNIEERGTIGSAGTDILSSDQVADTNGESVTSSFANGSLSKDNYLWLDISAVSGEVSYLEVTLAVQQTIELAIEGGWHGVTSPSVSLTQAHTLAMNDAANSVTSSEPSGAEDTDLVMDNGTSDVTSANITVVENSQAIVDVPLFYCWVISNPAVGGIQGPKATVGMAVDSIHSYITSGTSVAFNIEERNTIGSPGTDLMASDQSSVTTGAETESFSNSVIDEDSHLWIDISEVSGSPELLVITLAFTASLWQQPADCAHAVTSTSPALCPALDMDDSEHSVVSDSISIVYNEIPIAFTEIGFYTWVVESPATGGIPGPKLPHNIVPTEISSYITGTGTVSFNIESRSTIGSSGTNLLPSDQAADSSGESAYSFAIPSVVAGRQLWLDISATTLYPEKFVVTIAWENEHGFAQDCVHAVTSSSPTLSQTAGMSVSSCYHSITSTSPAPMTALAGSVSVTLTVTPVVLSVSNSTHSVPCSSPVFSGSTRIYLPSSGAASVFPAYNSAWDEAWSADALAATLDKGDTALGNKELQTQNYSSTYVLNRQYVLAPAGGFTAHNFTTSEMFDFVARNIVSPTDPGNIYCYLTIDIYSSDGITHRGTIFSGQVSELPIGSTLQARGADNYSLTGNVAMQNGDIIVIEIGVRSDDTSGAAYSVNQNFGDAPSAALSVGDTDTDNDYPYLEFPFLLYFYSPPAGADSCSHAVTSTSPNLGTNLSQVEMLAYHSVESTEIAIEVQSATLVVSSGIHSVSSSRPSVAPPPGRKLYVKSRGLWIQIAPET